MARKVGEEAEAVAMPRTMSSLEEAEMTDDQSTLYRYFESGEYTTHPCPKKQTTGLKNGGGRLVSEADAGG